GAWQLAGQFPSLWRVGYKYHTDFQWRDEGVRAVLTLMGPAVIAASAVQVNVLINSGFAASLGNGPVSWLNIAFRLMQLPLGIFGSRACFLCGPEGVNACVLCDRQTQHANDHQFLCDRRESFSELAFHISARVGTSWSGIFDEPRRDDQFPVALRVNATPCAQAGNAAAASWSRKNVSCRDRAGIGLLGGKLLVAWCLGALALSSKVMW